MVKWPTLWIGSIAVFVILGFLTPDAFAADAWCDTSKCDTNWQFRKLITIDNTKVGTDNTFGLLADFPFLVNFTGTDFTDVESQTQSSGADIRFTDQQGNDLEYEIELYDEDTNKMAIWVKSNSTGIAKHGSTLVYMYYGNSGASSTANAANVWDSNYVAVYHLNQTSFGADTTFDSTSNNNVGDPVGNTAAVSSGRIGGAVIFDGNGDEISIPDPGVGSSLDITATITLEAWVKTPSAVFYPMLLNKGTVNTAYLLFANTDLINSEKGRATFRLSGPGTISDAAAIIDDVWHHVVGTYDGSTMRVYVDGVQDGTPLSVSSAIATNDDPLHLGTASGGVFYLTGSLDEIRISNIARSADFIKTEYNNQNSPSTFYSVSTPDLRLSSDTVTITATGSGSITITKQNSNPEASAPSGTTAGSFFDITSTGTLSDRTVIMSYSDADIAGVDESSLTINRFSGGAWSALTTTVDTGANTATATTPGFSSFVLSGSSSSSTSTGGDDDIKPSYSVNFAENEYPISIDSTKFKFEELGFDNPTTTVETGKPVQVNLLIYDNDGPSYIDQVELYTNMNGIFRDVSNSDTSIIYKKGEPRIVLDPNGFFSNVILSSSEVNQKLQLTYDITFAKEMEKSDIIVQARDTGNNVGVLTVSDAWQVIQAPTAAETSEILTIEPTDVSVPGEIKVKTLNVEKPAYSMQEEILFYGTVDGYKVGSVVSIMIRNPSYGFLTLISTYPDKDGYYEARLNTDSKFKTDGTYTATAFADDPNRGMQTIFYFSRDAPPPSPVKTSPVQSMQAEQSTEPELTITSEPVTQSELVTHKPKPRPSFVDLDKDPQSYVDRYNNEASYKEWFDENYPDYTIYGAVGLAEPAKEKVPAWIQNNAKWWSEGQIDDGTFVSGIQFLMTEKIIDIPDLPEQASENARPSFVDPQKDPQSYVDRYNNEASYKEWFDKNHPDYTIEEAVGMPEPIPSWIKNNAKWWADGQISEDDFVGGIEWLVEQGIIKI